MGEVRGMKRNCPDVVVVRECTASGRKFLGVSLASHIRFDNLAIIMNGIASKTQHLDNFPRHLEIC